MTITTGTKLVLFGFWLGAMFGLFVKALLEVGRRSDEYGHKPDISPPDECTMDEQHDQTQNDQA